MVLTKKTTTAVAHAKVEEVTNAPVITTIKEKDVVDVIEKKTNVIVHKQPVITEVIEQPIIEVHETREVKHVREPSLQHKSVESTRYEDVNLENKISDSIKMKKLQELEKTNRAPDQLAEKSELVVNESAVLKRVEIQPIVEVHDQKFIKEVHEQNVHEIVEQPIIRRVYQQPIFRRIGENLYEEVKDTSTLTMTEEIKRDVVIVGDELKSATQAISDQVKKDASIVQREVKKGAEFVKQEAIKGTQKLEQEATHLKRVARRRGWLDREFLMPIGLLLASGVGLYLYNKYYVTPKPLQQ